MTLCLILAATLGIPLGVATYLWAHAEFVMTEAKTIVHIASTGGLFSFFLGAVLFRVKSRKILDKIGLFFVLAATLIHGMYASFNYAFFIGQQALTTTTVLNTEMILNIGTIFFGACLLVCMIPLQEHLIRNIGVKTAFLFLGMILIFPFITSIAELMLGLMKLQYIDVMRRQLAFVGKAIGFFHYYVYLQISLAILVSLVFFFKQPESGSSRHKNMDKARQRLALSRVMRETRYFKATAAFLCFLVIPLLYWDLYASQPPKLSKATPVVPNEEGLVIIPINEVSDGKLHRYSYVTEDGYVARFFLINRYQDKVRIGVVYDACMICGDMGYVQKDNEVICIACNVRMFLPSIGKEGGCNPIPMEYTQEDGKIIIEATELDAGSTYFSDIVEVEVTDPISGAKLINFKAPFQYSFKGRTYYFENKENFEKFRKEPEKIVTEQKKRYFRTEGYQ